MMIDNRSLVLDIYDYAGNKVCPLYDSSLDISGQAVSVMVTTERNGWKEISFSLPGMCATEEGMVPNFRLDYLKNDYRIRALFIGEEETIDWYIISEQQIKRRSVNIRALTVQLSLLRRLDLHIIPGIIVLSYSGKVFPVLGRILCSVGYGNISFRF